MNSLHPSLLFCLALRLLRSMTVKEFGHVWRRGGLAWELVYTRSSKAQAERALMLIHRLRLKI